MMMKNRLLPFWIKKSLCMWCVYIELKNVVVFHYQIKITIVHSCILLLTLSLSTTQADGLNFAKEMLLSTAESATFSASEVERRLHSDLRNGLTWQEALSRSKIIGYNELQAPQEDSTLMKYVEQFKNPLILLLLGKSISLLLESVSLLIQLYNRICTCFNYHATI